MSAIYLDSSAFIKLVVHESETFALQDYLAGERGRFTSSALLRTEALRAVRDKPQALPTMRSALHEVDLVAIDDDILDRAGVLGPGFLRTLDAIHVATALAIGDDLDVLVTYDERMIGAASSMGIPTATPG